MALLLRRRMNKNHQQQWLLLVVRQQPQQQRLPLLLIVAFVLYSRQTEATANPAEIADSAPKHSVASAVNLS